METPRHYLDGHCPRQQCFDHYSHQHVIIVNHMYQCCMDIDMIVPGKAQGVKEEAAGVAIALRLEGSLQPEEGAFLCLAARLAVVHPSLALDPSKQKELDHQQCACIIARQLQQAPKHSQHEVG